MPPVVIEFDEAALNRVVAKAGGSLAARLRELPRVREPDGSQWVDFELVEALCVNLEKAAG